MKWVLVFLFFIPLPAFAAEEVENAVDEGFDWLGRYFEAVITQSDLSDAEKKSLGNVLDTGVDTGKEGAGLFFAFHIFAVQVADLILTLTGYEIDVLFIEILAYVITAIAIAAILRGLFRVGWKIVIGVIIFIMIIGGIGIGVNYGAA